MLKTVFSPVLLQLITVILALILIPAHVVWLVERRHEGGIVRHKNYFPGIFEAGWWAISTLATQAEEMPKSPLGRMMAVFWMFVSVLFVAYFTAAVTTSLTVRQLQGNIKGPDDLPGKRVATTRGSTAAAYLKEQEAQVTEFMRIDEAFESLEKNQADAVVFDAPILLYYASHGGKGKVQTVGSIFRKEDYGIVFPTDSPHRKPINNALLRLKENGTYQALHDKWFGKSE